MTKDELRRIVVFYNTRVDEMRCAEKRMDAATTDKTRERAENDHSFALGEMSGIQYALYALGYDIVVDDDDYIVDIVPEDNGNE